MVDDVVVGRAIAAVLQKGNIRPAAVPWAGQMAPKLSVERVCWSCGADGRVPRGAHRGVISFFCPTRASSWNHTSIGLPAASLAAVSAKLPAKLF
jgi:hypothetical protein